jgi:hypothetical protein
MARSRKMQKNKIHRSDLWTSRRPLTFEALERRDLLASWNIAGGGKWENLDNWDPKVVPQVPTVDVTFPGTASGTVTMDQDRGIGNLTAGVNSGINLDANGNDLTVANLTVVATGFTVQNTDANTASDVTANSILVGDTANKGILNINGTGGGLSVTASSNLVVGDNGGGKVTVDQGAELNVGNAKIGTNGTNSGKVQVLNNSTFDASSTTLGDNTFTSLGGVLDVEGSTASLGTTVVAGRGELTIGAYNVNPTAPSHATADSVEVDPFGNLQIDQNSSLKFNQGGGLYVGGVAQINGTIENGTVTNNGNLYVGEDGILANMNLYFDDSVLDGKYVQTSNGNLMMDIQARFANQALASDTLYITAGDADLDGFIFVKLPNGGTLNLQDKWQLIDVTGGIVNGEFGNLNKGTLYDNNSPNVQFGALPALPDATWAWKGVYTNRGVWLEIVKKPQIQMGNMNFDAYGHTGQFAVTLEQPSDQTVSFHYQTSSGGGAGTAAVPGTDYQEESGDLTITPDNPVAYIDVPILALRDLFQSPVQFTVTISSDNADIADPTAIGTIWDQQFSITNDDFSTSSVSVNEAAGTVTLWVKPTSPSHEVPVSVAYANRNGTANLTPDYKAVDSNGPITGTLTWQPGDASPQPITVSIVNDYIPENTENFFIDLSNPVFVTAASPNLAFLNAGAGYATVTINDDDVDPYLNIDSTASVDEGDQVQVHIRLSGPSDKIITMYAATVGVTAQAGRDFIPQTTLIQFDPGDVDKVFSVPTIDDMHTTGDISFEILISELANAQAGQIVSTVTIIDNQAPTAVDDSYSTAVGVPVICNVLANDSDPEGDPLTVAIMQSPANGALTSNGDGSFTYTSSVGGPDYFLYSITDNHGNSVTARADVTVGTYTAGFTHAGGTWVDGYRHDNGTWSDGFNVYDSDFVFLFKSYDTTPDPAWANYDTFHDWVPIGGTVWTAGALDPLWVNAVAEQQFVGTGERVWTAAASPEPDWVDVISESRWV